jgi:hypothetical protein
VQYSPIFSTDLISDDIHWIISTLGSPSSSPTTKVGARPSFEILPEEYRANLVVLAARNTTTSLVRRKKFTRLFGIFCESRS